MASNAPTGLDLSSCSVTSTGGSTSTSLADLSKSVDDVKTDVATATQDASDAKTAATDASSVAADAKTAVENLGTTYVTAASIGSISSVAGLDSSGGVAVTEGGYGVSNFQATAYVTIGVYLDNKNTPGVNYGAVQFGNASGGNSAVYSTLNTWNDGTTGTNLAYTGASIHPSDSSSSGAALGKADHAWSNIYSQTAVTVTSDLSEKTVLDTLGVTSNSEGVKLAEALIAVSPIGYQLNSSIAVKGAADARVHYGYGAQTIRDAIQAAGLDPSKYALWTQTQRLTVTQVDSGRKDSKGNVIYNSVGKLAVDSEGNPVYIEMLRYEQIHTLLIWYVNNQVSSLKTEVADISAKLTALTAKAS